MQPMNQLMAVNQQTDHFQIVMKPHPFDSDTFTADVPSGLSIADALGHASHTAEVTLDGHHVPREMWGKIRPKAGHHLHVANFPQGGNGGKWIRLIAMVVLTYFTAGVASGAYGTVLGVSSASGLAALGAGMMMAGMLAITPMVGQPLEVHA